MVLRFFMFAGVFFFLSCGTIERDNPNDPGSKNYQGYQIIDPPSVEQSSSSSFRESSSSSVAGVSSSSVAKSSSSAAVSSSSSKLSSSSSVPPSSSSLAQSSSSAVVSSSSSTPSSSSEVTLFCSLPLILTAGAPVSMETIQREYLKCRNNEPAKNPIITPAVIIISETSANVARTLGDYNNLYADAMCGGKPVSANCNKVTIVSGSSVASSSSVTVGTSSSSVITITCSFAKTTYAVGENIVMTISCSNALKYDRTAATFNITGINPVNAEDGWRSGGGTSYSSTGTSTVKVSNVYCGTNVLAPEATCPTLTITAATTLPSSSSRASSSSVASSSAVVSSSSAMASSSSVGCTATNNTSTQYCSNGTMKQYGSVTDDGGKTYKTVVIGTQTWMAENLNYNVSGSKCGNGSTLSDTNTTTCDTYGRLYNWATAMALSSDCNSASCSSQIDTKHKGICPSGWHIPNNADWDKLIHYVDDSTGTSGTFDNPTAGGPGTSGWCSLTADKYLKTTSGWYSMGNGEDKYGFSALPGGSGYSDGSFGRNGYGSWWSSNEYSSSAAYGLGMGYSYVGVGCSYATKSYSLISIRCLKN